MPQSSFLLPRRNCLTQRRARCAALAPKRDGLGPRGAIHWSRQGPERGDDSRRVQRDQVLAARTKISELDACALCSVAVSFCVIQVCRTVSSGRHILSPGDRTGWLAREDSNSRMSRFHPFEMSWRVPATKRGRGTRDFSRTSCEQRIWTRTRPLGRDCVVAMPLDSSMVLYWIRGTGFSERKYPCRSLSFPFDLWTASTPPAT